MDSYKAPGSDGFNPIFFKTPWDTVEEDIWPMVQDLGGFPKQDL